MKTIGLLSFLLVSASSLPAQQPTLTCGQSSRQEYGKVRVDKVLGTWQQVDGLGVVTFSRIASFMDMTFNWPSPGVGESYSFFGETQARQDSVYALGSLPNWPPYNAHLVPEGDSLLHIRFFTGVYEEGCTFHRFRRVGQR